MGILIKTKFTFGLRFAVFKSFLNIMAFSGRLVSRLLLRPATRPMSGAAAVNDSPAKADVHPVYFKLKERQARMKENLHLPVHRKGGKTDDSLRYFTYALAAYAVFATGSMIYEMAYPPKKN